MFTPFNWTIQVRSVLGSRQHCYRKAVNRCNHNIRSTTIAATWARMYSCTVITVFCQKPPKNESSKQVEIGDKLCLLICYIAASYYGSNFNNA